MNSQLSIHVVFNFGLNCCYMIIREGFIIQRVSNADPTKIHVIGHSLGAHIAGYAGEKTPNLGRITGNPSR